MLDSKPIRLYNITLPAVSICHIHVYSQHTYTHNSSRAQRASITKGMAMIKVTNEQHETIYINPKYIVSLKPLEKGTVVNLITETLTVHETIEHILISC